MARSSSKHRPAGATQPADTLLSAPPADPAATQFSEDVGTFLIRLYRAAAEEPTESFCRRALLLLKDLVYFDSAMWGHGFSDPVVINDVVLHNQPAEMMANYAKYQKEDFFAAAVGVRAPRSVNIYDVITRRELLRKAIYRKHAAIYGMNHFLCTLLPEQTAGLASFISLWRADYDNPYSESDRALKQFVMPQLVEARRQNLFGRLRAAAGHPSEKNQTAAVCDPLGVLHHADGAWAEIVQSHWPTWTGPALPAAMSRALRKQTSGAAQFGALHLTWQPLESRLLLQLRRQDALDSLSSREVRVATLVADGLTDKDIAARLGVSSATVRSQIASTYRKLGVHNRAQLLKAIDRSRFEAPAGRPPSA